MRILMLSDVYFPRVNGVSSSIHTFREQLLSLGHHVTLVAPAYPEDYDDDEDTIRVASRRVPRDPEDRLMVRAKLFGLEKRLAQQQFDVIHIQTPFIAHYFGLTLRKALNIPVVETYHTFFEEYLFHYIPFLPKSWMRFCAKYFSRRQCNAVDAVIVPSRAMKKVLTDYGITSPMEILPTGIQLEAFSSGDGVRFRQQYQIDQDRPVITFIGRVAFEKNIAFLLRMMAVALKTTPNILFVIAGEGPALPSLQKLTAQLNLSENVKFIGYLARKSALPDCYCAANAFVFASNTETQGLVLLEAMALGVPVVSTAAMGTIDILEGNPAAIVCQEDEQTFAHSLCQLLDDKEKQRAMSEAGRVEIKKWTAEAMAERLVIFYDRLHFKIE